MDLAVLANSSACPPWPSLKGQQPEYMVMQMQNFKHGLRANDTGKMMRNVVERMSEMEMKSVAAYIAGIQ